MVQARDIKCWIGAASLAMALLSALVLSAPDPRRSGLAPVAASEIQLFAPGFMMIPMQPAAVQDRTPLSRQHEWAPDAARQYHLVVRSPAEALFVPRLGAASQLWINGMPVAKSEPLRITSFGTGHEMLAAALPPTAMKFSDNRIDIVTDSDNDNAGLAGIYIGSLAAVTQAANAQKAWWSMLEAAALLAATVGLASGLVGQLFGQNRLAHGGAVTSSLAALLIWAHGRESLGAISDLPLHWPGAAGLAGGLLVLVALRGQVGGLGVVLRGLALTSLIAALLALIALQAPGGFPVRGGFIANSGLLAVPLLGAPLLLLREAQAYFGQLAAAKNAIAEQRQIISLQEAALEEQIRAKAIIEERQRFVRDMHDGVGGQLLSLLMRVRMGKVELNDVEDEIERGITDLRLVADSLDNVGNDLEAALATFKTRARQQLDAAHMTLEWHQPDQLGVAGLDARQILSLYRLLQEAVTNAVRHSGGSKIAVVFDRLGAGGLAVSITDNGQGLDSAMVKAGNGLGNMAKRAEALGGSLNIGRGEHDIGTSISVALPDLAAAL